MFLRSSALFDVIKHFLEKNEEIPKIKKLKYALMSELALKCETNCAILKQNQTAKLLIGIKLAYSCCLSLKGSPDFQYFVQKCFLTSTTVLVKAASRLFTKLGKLANTL